MKIPLGVVLEGIDQAFESRRRGHGTRRKSFSLVLCHSSVLRKFELYRERRVGRRASSHEGPAKEGRILQEVREFLERVPRHLSFLKELFQEVEEPLARGSGVEEDLERADDRIDELLLHNAAPEDRERARKEVLAGFPISDEKELKRVTEVKLVKSLRLKHKIPHVSPYYYG